MAKPERWVYELMCESVRMGQAKRSYVESAVLGNGGANPNAFLYLRSEASGDEKRPGPLGFEWGKKYRVTIEPID